LSPNDVALKLVRTRRQILGTTRSEHLLHHRSFSYARTQNQLSRCQFPPIDQAQLPSMSMFRAKKLDLGCFIKPRTIRDHTKRLVFEKFEPERYASPNHSH
jgi:hypothetical protein